jgi:citronellol/citronellal dehydrogenase
MAGGNPNLVQCYTADIMGDAAVRVLTKDARTFTGNFLEDEVFLQQQGVTNFDQYTVTDSSKL